MTPGLASDPAFGRLKEYVIAHTGLAYYAEKDDMLADRLGRRLSSLGMTGCADYLSRLRDESAGEPEMDALVAELTIGETYFFRHREQFDALRDVVLPEILQRNQASRRVRLWSACCASGEEPYSLSILLKDDFGVPLSGWDVTLLATDINRTFLGRAREGRYEDWAFRTNTEDFRRKHFKPVGKSWVLEPRYREGVAFQCHNMVKHPFPSLVQNITSFDVIVCRNAMIYFDAPTCRKILSQLHECLVEGGWLILGHAEMLPDLPFETVQAAGTVLYRKNREKAGRYTGGLGASSLPSPLPALLAPLPSMPSVIDWTPPSLPPLPQASPLEKPAAPTPLPADTGLAAVRSLVNEGDWDKAFQLCESLAARDSLNPAVHFYKALVLEQMGSLSTAEDALRRALYLDRQSLLIHYHLGLFLQKRGDPKGASRSFQNVLDLSAKRRGDDVIPDADGLLVSDLADLAGMQLEVLSK
jgi:chemotaxis protein methyltransferase CheR